ncbi:Transcription factor TFIIIB component B'' [Galdieria sulphuraria]|uniref:Transcription factor n=1 Tax=Galdieria sulphuraria TaxID=130081 RepID=M2VXJ2_GALSU|nr:transcription factor [Galdieria sulphuraria]EME27986.1 transcription factor [Galdieria sulphuraria]GJD11784.1 Transcription factor TFIIIB component B'' [Galdieria sulphuraria]|eukprot:XP_005704506.1 transcription factor [Galdieria sulphuraria]
MPDDLRKQTISELITQRKKTGLQLTPTISKWNKKRRKSWEQLEDDNSSMGQDESWSPPSSSTNTVEKGSSMAPQLKFDDEGNITVDEDSLIVATDAPTQVESQVVRVVNGPDRVNSATYSKRTTTERWTKEETELFYRGLQQFGTDFSLVAQLFPKRNRKQVKAKFKREEKIAPDKVDAALSLRTTVSVPLETLVPATSHSLETGE